MVVPDVILMSGKRISIEADLGESLESLNKRARRALGVGRGRLLDASGSLQDGDATLSAAGLRAGECVTLHIGKVQNCRGYGFFAAIRGNGSIATWRTGEHIYGGGDGDAVQNQNNLQQIQASGAESHSACAAILGDGAVVTWGSAGFGGDSTGVQDKLKNVQQIQASDGAFAAFLGDGSVVTWGAGYGGDSSAVQDPFKHVQQSQASYVAFCRHIARWGLSSHGGAGFGGDSTAVQHQLKNVQQIQASREAFAAILGDGSVVTWGNASFGGDSNGHLFLTEVNF